MNRFKALLANTAVGASFQLTAESIGMDERGFDQFVDTIINVAQVDFVASNPHRESDGQGRYDAVVITRTA